MQQLARHAIALFVSDTWTRNPPRGRELYYRTRAAVVYARVMREMEQA